MARQWLGQSLSMSKHLTDFGRTDIRYRDVHLSKPDCPASSRRLICLPWRMPGSGKLENVSLAAEMSDVPTSNLTPNEVTAEGDCPFLPEAS